MFAPMCGLVALHLSWAELRRLAAIAKRPATDGLASNQHCAAQYPFKHTLLQKALQQRDKALLEPTDLVSSLLIGIVPDSLDQRGHCPPA